MTDRLKALPVLSLIGFINILFSLVSVKAAWSIGERLGSLCYRIMPKRRKTIQKNLQIVANYTSTIELSPELAKTVFQRNIANLSCSLKTYGMQPAQLSDYVVIRIDAAFEQAIQDNKGAILCLAHMGNWEILSKISSLITPEPQKFGALYRPLDNRAADQYVVKQRERYRCKMFPKYTPMGTLSTFIREGGILGILADQRNGRAKKNHRPFFGVDSARSKLPAVLHMRTQAPLFTASVSCPKAGKWLVEIKEIPLDSQVEKNSENVLRAVTQSYEENFAKHVLDIFWLHRYWV